MIMTNTNNILTAPEFNQLVATITNTFADAVEDLTDEQRKTVDIYQILEGVLNSNKTKFTQQLIACQAQTGASKEETFDGLLYFCSFFNAMSLVCANTAKLAETL